MNKRQYNFLLYRFLCFLMAIYVINVSIDTPDMSSFSGRTTAHHEDFWGNKIESISEFVLETCLGIVDAVPEHDDPDEDSEPTGQEQDYAFTQLFRFTPTVPAIHYLTTGSLPFRSTFFPTPVAEIVAPPPQFSV